MYVVYNPKHMVYSLRLFIITKKKHIYKQTCIIDDAL